MEISNEQKFRYACDVTEIIRNTINPNKEEFPEIVWHYTSSSTFIEIIKSKSLWATQISCLNDTRELRHLFDLIFEEFEKRSNVCANGVLKPLYDYLKSQKNENRVPDSNCFVASFCTEGDDLNLWRAYAGGENGVSIGFKSRDLIIRNWEKDRKNNCIENKSFPTTYLLPVIYENGKKNCIIVSICDKIEKYFIDLSCKCNSFIENFWSAWENQLLVISPLIKHESFYSEKEWRLIKQFPDINDNSYQNEMKDLRYLARRTTITRHWPVKMPPINISEDSKDLLPLDGIKIGPGPQQDLMKTNVKSLLLSNGYDVEGKTENSIHLSLSKIPFRSL